MPNFTAGTSFTDGVTNDVTAAKLNALIADAVPTSSLSLNSTTGTIANFSSSTANITNGTITNLTNGTTTATAEIITTGTIQSLTSSTANITSGTFGGLINSTTGTFGGSVNSSTGTIGTFNSTTGTIGNLSTTLAGDLTISQGTATLGTSGVTASSYGTTSDIPRITVDAKGRITSATTVTAPVGFRNRIINGDMRIDQRNAGASFTPTTDSAYTVDRWCARLTQTSKFSVAQNAGSVTPPSGFTKYIGVTSLSSFSVGAGDFFAIEQRIEGQNIDDLVWGTAGAKTVTLSFWVRSSLTGTFGGVFNNGGIAGAARSYPFSYTISSANTWEQKTITVSGDTSGTWITTNGIGIQVIFALGVGSTYSTTAGSWTGGNASIGGYLSATGATSVVGTNGATFYITGVQLEAGSTATDFERRPYGTELALCQRYYYQYPPQGSGAVNSFVFPGGMQTGANCLCPIFHPVEMRAGATLTAAGVASDYYVIVNSTTVNCTSLPSLATGSLTRGVALTFPMTASVGYAAFGAAGTSTAKLSFSSEL